MSSRPLKIAYLTAGAAGMICGSCLHDNTLARALIELGHDVQLIPLYTPIRTDEQDVTLDRIFYGGINMYLQQKVPLFRWLPKWLDRWLDQPWLIDWAAGRSVKIDPKQVADIDALDPPRPRGLSAEGGRAAGRVADRRPAARRDRVQQHPHRRLRPRDQAAAERAGRRHAAGRRHLPPRPAGAAPDAGPGRNPHAWPSRSTASSPTRSSMPTPWRSIWAWPASGSRSCRWASMRGILRVQGSGFRVQNGIRNPKSEIQNPTVGYLARLAPEKGLHILADAFIRLRQMPGMEQARLRIAGWLGEQQSGLCRGGLRASCEAAGLGDAFEYVGEVDRRGKLDFLASIDVLAVPTTYREPKGLFVLEALAAGVPVVQPDHGAFPEVLARTAGAACCTGRKIRSTWPSGCTGC